MKTKNWYKGLTATAITLAMAGAALTVPAMAIDYDLNYGNVFVEGTESWQQDTAGNQFHYVVSNTTEGSYEFVSGKYQHTPDDTTVHITQGTIDKEQIINEEDTNDTVDEGAVLEEVKGNAQTGVAVDSTVTISNGTTGDDTDTGTAADGTTGTTSGGGTEENTEAVDAVDVTISDVNVDIEGKEDFITVNDNTTADITIENSTVQTNGNMIDIGVGSDVTLNLDNSDVTADGSAIVIGSETGEGSTGNISIEKTNISAGLNGISVGVNSDADITMIDSDIYGGWNNQYGNAGLLVNDNSDVEVSYSGDNTIKGSFAGIVMKGDSNLTFTGETTDDVDTLEKYFEGEGELSGDVMTISADGTDAGNGFGAGVWLDGKGDKTITIAGGTTMIEDTNRIGIDSETRGNKTEMSNLTINVGTDATLSDDRTTEKKESYSTNFSVHGTKWGPGFYLSQYGTTTFNINNAYFRVNENAWDGIYGGCDNASELCQGMIYYVNDSYMSTSYNGVGSGGSGNGIAGQPNTYANTHMDLNNSIFESIGNRSIGVNNTNTSVINSSIEVSDNGSHGWTNGYFDLYNSTGIFSGNKYYGLNITRNNKEGLKSQIINSSLYASNNGWDDAAWTTNVNKAGIDFAVGAQIKNSIVIADNNATGVSKVNGTTPDTNIIIRYDVDVWDSYVHATGAKSAITLYNTSAAPAFLNVNPSSVITLQGNQYDLFDDWNSGAGHTGRTVVSGGSLQGALDNMHSFYININTDTKLTEEQLAGMSQLELYMYICQNYGKNINAAIDSVYTPGSANKYEYAGPVNSDGTILFRFDLNGEVDKGAALTYNTENNTYTFTYYDPNTGNEVAYTFRYNTNEEDLTGTGDHAYVWTPVTIINYDPLNNDLSGSQIGTAHNNDDNTATDVTIFGTTINLGEKDMPSYETKVDTQVTTTTGADGSIITTTTTTTSTYGWWVHVDEEGKLQVITPPAKDASQEEWDAFYALLNYQVTEETNLLELCDGDTALAESITVYGMWTSETEQTVVTTPAEPEIPDPPYIPDYPELPDYDPPEVDIDDPDVPLVEEPEEPEEPEQPTEEIDDEETPLTPSIPDEVVDEIIAEIEDEVTPLTSVPKTGAEMPAATAALPAGVLTLAIATLVRRIRRKD